MAVKIEIVCVCQQIKSFNTSHNRNKLRRQHYNAIKIIIANY